MKKQIIRVIILLIATLFAMILLSWCSEKKITAWYYLDKITEVRQEKQALLDQITVLDKTILDYKEKMNALQYTWLDYLGFEMETESQ
jgi:peptidoglycan hydrolase CwlO-like protein